MSEQYVFDFSSRANDRCAKALGLRSVAMDISPGRVEGIIELVQRLVLFARYLPESIAEDVHVRAQVAYLQSRIERRKVVSERTIRNWTADAKALGILSVQYVSHQRGGSQWNNYTIHFGRLLDLISGRVVVEFPGGNGRQRAATVAAPRAAMVAGPGAATAAAPNNVFTREHSQTTETEPVVCGGEEVDFSKRMVDALLAMGMDRAHQAVSTALARGLTEEQIDELVELYRRQQPGHARMTVAWLFRWLTGQSSPPKATASPAAAPEPVHCGGRGDGLTRQQVQAERIRMTIVRDGRRVGASEDEIRRRCLAAGVNYD